MPPHFHHPVLFPPIYVNPPPWFNPPFYAPVIPQNNFDPIQFQMQQNTLARMNLTQREYALEKNIKIRQLRRKLKAEEDLDKKPPYRPPPPEIPQAFYTQNPSDIVENFFEKNLRYRDDPFIGRVNPNLINQVDELEATVRSTKDVKEAGRLSEHAKKVGETNEGVLAVIKNYENGYQHLIESGMNKNEAALMVMDHLDQNVHRPGWAVLQNATGRNEPDRMKLSGSMTQLLQYKRWRDSPEKSSSARVAAPFPDPDNTQSNSTSATYTPDATREVHVPKIVTLEDERQEAMDHARSAIKHDRDVIKANPFVKGALVDQFLKKLESDLPNGVLGDDVTYDIILPVNKAAITRKHPELEGKYDEFEETLYKSSHKPTKQPEDKLNNRLNNKPINKVIDPEFANEIAEFANAITESIPGLVDPQSSAQHGLPSDVQKNGGAGKGLKRRGTASTK